MAAGGRGAEVPVSFENVIVHFSKEEWVMLEKWQKELYWEVLKDNYEALLIVGNAVTKSDILAWFEQNERRNYEGTREPRDGDSSGSSCAQNDELAQMCRKGCTGQVGPLKVVRGRSTESMAPHEGMGGIPGHRSVTHQERFARNEPPRHTERGKGVRGLAGLARSRTMALKPFKCRVCGERFRLRGLLQIHQRIGMRNTSFPYPEGEMRFPSSSHLRVHRRTHLRASLESGRTSPVRARPLPLQEAKLEVKLQFCASCGGSFRSYLSLLQHQKVHDEATPQPCAQCGVIFMYQSDLALHEESHLEDALREHAACGKSCICECSLRLHFASHPGKRMEGRESGSQARTQPRSQEGKPYLCNQCGLRFTFEVNLEAHYRYHHKDWQLKPQSTCKKEVPFPCLESGLHFLSPSHPGMRRADVHTHARAHSAGASLTRAQPVHLQESKAEEVLYRCMRCGGSFRNYLSLLQHQKVHDEATPQPCAQCGVIFMYQSDLALHEESHLEDALREHAACGKSCICECSLRLHFASHPGKRMEGQESGSQARTQPRSQEGKPYLCNQCGLRFTFEVNLEAHYRYRHKEWWLKGRANGAPQIPFPMDRKGCTKQERSPAVPGGSRDDSWRTSCPPPRPLHICSDCGKGFVSQLGFRRHQQKHKAREGARGGAKPGKRADSAGGLTVASVMKTLHACQECGSKFVYKWQLAAHLAGHAGGKSSQRPPGGRGFEHRSHLSRHRQRPARGGTGQEGQNRESPRLPAVAANWRTSERNQLCQCGKCGKILTERYLPCHWEFHAGWKYRCLLCGMVSNFRSGAARHLKLHREKGDLPAGLKCGRGSRCRGCCCMVEKIYTGPGLEQLALGGLGHPSEAFPTEGPCARRGKSVISKSCLSVKQPVPSGGKQSGQTRRASKLGAGCNIPRKPFRCSVCGKSFAYVTHLLKHRTAHGQRPFLCAECGKSFTHQRYLNRHWKAHRGESA